MIRDCLHYVLTNFISLSLTFLLLCTPLCIGPWSYRIASLVLMTPMYSALLVIVGTVFGRHAYFRHFR